MGRNSNYFLQNSRGEKLQLCSLLEHPLNKYSINYEMIRYSDDADFEINQENLRFIPYEIELSFNFDDYTTVQQGIDFIDYNEEMILQKEVIAEGITYSKRIIFAEARERPIRQVESYNATLIATTLSEWFTTISINIVPPSTGGAYPLQYPFVYASGPAGEVIIVNNYHRRLPLQLEINGPSTNPSWDIRNSLGEIVYEGSVTVVVPSDQKLVVKSDRSLLYLADLVGTPIPSGNQYQNQDFTKETFMFLDKKDTYTVRVQQQNIEDVNAVLVYLQTRAVV